MKLFYTLLLFYSNSVLLSQSNDFAISFAPTFNGLPLELKKNYSYKNDSLKISTIKFYISDIRFYQNNLPTDSVVKTYHLIDLENPASLTIKHLKNNAKPYNSIRFNLGVDSTTNVSGAFGGDLDPTNGMYWTWQSGYINLKLEGQSKICPSRNNLFSFHIGGYQHPYNTMQNLNFKVNGKDKIVCTIDFSKLLNSMKLNETYEVMSPNSKAIEMAKRFADSIKIVE
jgi:hypothetical protein